MGFPQFLKEIPQYRLGIDAHEFLSKGTIEDVDIAGMNTKAVVHHREITTPARKEESMTLSVASYRSPKTRVVSSKTHGRGLFATKRIPKGEIVSVRGGHILTRPMLKQRRLPPGYWGYPIADGFVLGPLTKRETESVMMFLNHSCEPNVGIKGQIVFVAMRDIRVGEELTIDYAMFGADTKPMRCRCGAAACRKVITSADWRLRALQKKYAGYFSWQIVQRLARP